MSDESSESEAEQLEGGNIKGVDQVRPYNTDNSYLNSNLTAGTMF